MNIYNHILTVISIIVGLAITRILVGFADFVQHPDRLKPYTVQVIWGIALMIHVLRFWWWEYQVDDIGSRAHILAAYFFIATYACLLFFLCTLLFPDDPGQYGSYLEYFISVRRGFFAVLIGVLIVGIPDSAIKGEALMRQYHSPQIWLYIGVIGIGSIIAMRVRSARYHYWFASTALLSEILWTWLGYFRAGRI